MQPNHLRAVHFEARHAGSSPVAGGVLDGTGQLRAGDFLMGCKGGLLLGQPGGQGNDGGALGKLQLCLRTGRGAGRGEVHRRTLGARTQPAEQPGEDLGRSPAGGRGADRPVQERSRHRYRGASRVKGARRERALRGNNGWALSNPLPRVTSSFVPPTDLRERRLSLAPGWQGPRWRLWGASSFGGAAPGST